MALWSHSVETHWHSPSGFFKRSPERIASGLRANSTDKAQAVRRLQFYINRAGSNLSSVDRRRLERAKAILEASENPWNSTDSWILGGAIAAGVVAVLAYAVTARANPAFTSGTTPAGGGTPS